MVRRYRDYGRVLGYGPLKKVPNLGVGLDSPLATDYVDLVLHYDDILDSCYLQCRQMLPSLWLRTLLGGRDEQHCTIHYRCARYHHRHQGLVTGSVYEGDHSQQLLTRVLLAVRVLTPSVVPAIRSLVEGGVGVAQLDAYAPLSLLRVGVRPDPGEGLSQGGLAMVYVTDHADVDYGLSGQTLSQFNPSCRFIPLLQRAPRQVRPPRRGRR